MTRLQFLLKREKHNPRDIEAVEGLLSGLGIAVSAAGAATVSGRIGDGRFRELFGADAASPSAVLKVPDALREYVSGVSIAPEHSYMEERDKGSRLS